MAKAKAKKTRVTSAHIAEARANKGRDLSPKWDGHENWSADEFSQHFREAMQYYNLEYAAKDMKPAVVKWMQEIGCTKEDVSAFKKTKDWRCGATMGAIASCLNRGMPAVRADFNNGKDTGAWLRARISEVIENGKEDYEAEETDIKTATTTVSIQDRVREAALGMTIEIEDAIELFHQDREAFNPKEFKIISVLRGQQAKAAHARIIKDFYAPALAEYEEVYSGNADEQLKEGYEHISKKHIRKILDFYQDIISACDMLTQEAKVNRAPRVKKPVAKDKLVAKLKYLKQDDKLKLVSVNPVDVIGAKELWVYNVKSRKLGKYVAADFADLTVKGTSIINFNENLSVQKTLRKPEEQLKDFKAAGKVQLRKFLEDIKAVDIKLNGRINEDIILLKVA